MLVLSSLIERVPASGVREIRLVLAERKPLPGGGGATEDIVESQISMPSSMLDALRSVLDDLSVQLAQLEASGR